MKTKYNNTITFCDGDKGIHRKVNRAENCTDKNRSINENWMNRKKRITEKHEYFFEIKSREKNIHIFVLFIKYSLVERKHKKTLLKYYSLKYNSIFAF